MTEAGHIMPRRVTNNYRIGQKKVCPRLRDSTCLIPSRNLGHTFLANSVSFSRRVALHSLLLRCFVGRTAPRPSLLAVQILKEKYPVSDVNIMLDLSAIY